MSALRRFLVTLLVVAAAAAGLWYGWRSWDEHADVQSTNDAYVGGDITVISPRVAGYATEILVDDNTPVKAGQVLVRLDPRDFRAAVERAKATLAQTEALAEQARQRLDLQQQQIKVAQAALDSAEAQGKNTGLALSRARELLSRGSGTQVTFDAATATDVSAQAGVDQARAQLAYQRQQLGVLEADLRVSQTRIDDAKAQLGTVQIALEDTQVWSPLDGIVANRRTRVGEYVTVGSRMMSVVPSDGLWIDANFRETQLEHMRPDQPASIALDTYKGRRVCGYVEAIGPASGSEFALVPADNATGNFTKIVRRFPVRIRASAADPNRSLLKPGMSTTVTVAVDRPAVDGCGFDPDRDRHVSPPPRLPAHPGLAHDEPQGALAQ